MTNCAVPGCNEIGYHQFPKDKKRRRLWANLIKRPEIVKSTYARICLRHFTENDYKTVKSSTGFKFQRRVLKENVIPSVFPWTSVPLFAQGFIGDPAKINQQCTSYSNKPTQNPALSRLRTNEELPFKNTSKNMLIRCCVPLCNTNGGHRFPRDPKRKKQWLKAICRDSLICTDGRVCRNHFLPTDYLDVPSTQNRNAPLKPTAVPSVFAWNYTNIYDKRKEQWRRAKVAHRKRKNKGIIEGEEVGKDVPDPSSMIVVDSLKSDWRMEQNLGQLSECRACLQKERTDRLFSLFQGWAPRWDGLGPTIAEDFSSLSNVQLSESDLHPKFICFTCCEKLWMACHFKMLVQGNDQILRQRETDEKVMKEWPKPIQVDKSIDGVYELPPFNVDIKQEVLTDEEAGNMDEAYTDVNYMEIKIEPEEIMEQPQIIVNGVTSLKEFPTSDIAKQIMNGESKTEEDLQVVVKQEPVSDVEDTELPLECLLCSRPFNSVTGLKAHVIAQHSYQSVGRDAGPPRTGDKYVCASCRRTFTTSTDLMVHETCHGRACYRCGRQCASFAALRRHTAVCRARPAQPAQPKGLPDVVRKRRDSAQSEEKNELLTESNNTPQTNTIEKEVPKLFSCPTCSEIFTDSYYVKIHQEAHHSNETDQNTEEDSDPMEIEMLENMDT